MSETRGRHFAGQEDSTIQRTSASGVTQPKSAVPNRKNARDKKKDSKKRNGAKKQRHVVSAILLLVGILLIAASGVLFVKSQWDYHQQDVINEELAQYATVPENNVEEAPGIDWAGLRAINKEVVGWIQIPNSPVNYPVYQTTDNEHYLHTNAKGEYSVGGQIFMDHENDPSGLVDQQTILYGHHMRNGSMFQYIGKMNDKSVFDSVTTIWYETPEKKYELVPLFIYHANDDDESIRQFNFSSKEEFHEYLLQKLNMSVNARPDAADIIARTDHVMTLITCNYSDQYGRAALVCVQKSDIQK